MVHRLTACGSNVIQDEIVKTNTAKGPKLPTGRVVGVIKRKWRQYCGILQKSILPGVSNAPVLIY